MVDTSASVDDQLLARALGEVDGAISALGVPDSNITIYSVDAAVHTVAKVRRAQDAKLVGAGGTDLRIGLRAVELERPRPDVIIVFTDGDTPWPASPPPGAIVIAAILGRDRKLLPQTPNWVTRVECVLES
ncbi:MAG TPA: VWA-like domain-containing protein [Terrimesophilobacter sp.]|nr:VWA-like domain-containing protein [Terrimesophilobacter sp.]